MWPLLSWGCLIVSTSLCPNRPLHERSPNTGTHQSVTSNAWQKTRVGSTSSFLQGEGWITDYKGAVTGNIQSVVSVMGAENRNQHLITLSFTNRLWTCVSEGERCHELLRVRLGIWALFDHAFKYKDTWAPPPPEACVDYFEKSPLPNISSNQSNGRPRCAS
jgi:hypothetical protein